MSSPEVLLVITPFAPKQEWLANLNAKCPSVEVITYPTELYAQEVPKEVPADVWKRTTCLFTWKAFPPKEWVPNLQFVQLLSAGCAQIFGLPLFEETEIAFSTSNGSHAYIPLLPADFIIANNNRPQVSEWVIGTWLAHQHFCRSLPRLCDIQLLIQPVPHYLDLQKQRRWVDPDSDEDTEDSVGLRVGILGYGNIGRQVAKIATSLGMDVHAYTLHERGTAESRKDDGFVEAGLGDPDGLLPSKWFHGKDQLNDFLASDLDLLVILLPLTEQTRNMISKEQFALLSKKKTYVCNAGRGPIVNTEDLIMALDTEQIRGAALDVTDPEPLPSDSKLWGYKNVIITPHCAGNSNHVYERVFKIMTYNLERRSKGEQPINKVRKSLGY
ncbi:hypothetical protein LCI18_013609 [Fusarium solani-melongenae]|uniref:Uncharacterized protein n=1 Tax=Fusarium solani subsp. cucurbitae TaxID=2747967 RepID=A0ACD3ZMX9_FUSSC|nr:hypothetical protein LCI18_013609 [Fusarium solani-melongenae]